MASDVTGTNGLSVSARLRIQVVVPPLVRILKNQHPAVLDAPTAFNASAAQVVEVRTNVTSGFCLELGRHVDAQSTWQVRVQSDLPVTLVGHEGGYRLCGQRPGHFHMTLQHEFQRTEPSSGSLPWPVRTDLSVI